MFKRNFIKAFIPLFTVAALLSGCASDSWGTKQTVGTLGGAAAGGLLGAQFGKGSGALAMTAVGGLLGAYVGNEIGASLDNADRAAADQASQRAYSAPMGQQITWNNPENGHSGVIVPVKEGRSANGSYCREFQQNINVGGKSQQAYGTACQQPDGSWKIVQQ